MSVAKVGIVIPVYNMGSMIGRCIESVIDQTRGDWELIVCNDHSSDNTVKVVEGYLGDKRTSMCSNESQLGDYKTVCAGVARTNLEYLKVLDADDILHPTFLEKTIAMLDSNPSVGICSTRAEVLDDSGRLLDVHTEPFVGKTVIPRNEALRWTLRHVNPFGNPSRTLIRREAYDSVGGFNTDIEYCTEYDLWIRMLERWDHACVPEVLVSIYQHSQNETKRYAKRARHLTTGEQMFHKLFSTHKYFKGHWLRQQMVFLVAWRIYWLAAIRHSLKNDWIELQVLVKTLRRNSYVVIWLPVLLWRYAVVISRKFVLKSAAWVSLTKAGRRSPGSSSDRPNE